MELIDQHTKAIMEGCKARARDVGLQFSDETLEYIVSNKDLLELSPKMMIPTLYDYWVHDVEVLKEKGRYELYPTNPYETVINTRPPISFYNDNNPDWLNVMIFYHVLAHIDFFQNNIFFQRTRDYDFTARALADKRTIAGLRAEKGRWVDYVIEFARGIDNLVGYYHELSAVEHPQQGLTPKLDYFFDCYLQQEKKVRINEYLKEVDKFNLYRAEYGDLGSQSFLAEIANQYPEFEAKFRKYQLSNMEKPKDLLQFIMEHSPFINRDENRWMKVVLGIIRETSLFIQPQIRTKIMNEGWASYWHEKLFLSDDRINGHEVDFAKVHAGVVSMPRVGLNPYALGMRLFTYIEEKADRGCFTLGYQRMRDLQERKNYNAVTGKGIEKIFDVRTHFNDYLFISTFLDQDFMDQHKLFVSGKRLDQDRMVWQYYVKSRKIEDYLSMLREQLYHPPKIVIDEERTSESQLYLNHEFEGKPLVTEFIANTMMGIEFLWGATVKLETSEVAPQTTSRPSNDQQGEKVILFRRVLYIMEKRKLSKRLL